MFKIHTLFYNIIQCHYFIVIKKIEVGHEMVITNCFLKLYEIIFKLFL